MKRSKPSTCWCSQIVLRSLRPRAKAALAAKKAAGAALGNPRNLDEAGALGRVRLSADADEFAANVLPMVQELRASGTRGYGFIASALNQRGVRAARGGRWHVSTVQNVLARSQGSG